jgi:hypothetical protein
MVFTDLAVMQLDVPKKGRWFHGNTSINTTIPFL